MQPNKCVLELVGFSASIPQELQLKDNFITKQTQQVPRIAQMAFDLDANYFQFKNERRTFTCEQLRNPTQCLNNLEKLLEMKDPNFLALFQVQFYRDEQLLSAVSTLIFDMKDSCFLRADGFVQQNGIYVIFERHMDSKYCKLVEGQQVEFQLNITSALKTSIVNSQLKFSLKKIEPSLTKSHWTTRIVKRLFKMYYIDKSIDESNLTIYNSLSFSCV
ncbi:Hypothetical_protein [Hexamita inflata]|uniref:Hypothetical_protein n=1 Tax=Hexamita inflata TaxID=28002 RepID=A0AA86U714_9EUKA|nr:Hypothetical protein HINF_LOCUS31184 [Hexamita inflata]